MSAILFLPLLFSAQQPFEDLSALDRRLADASDNRAIAIDKRLRLARCPSPVQIEMGPQGHFAVRCIPAGWQLQVATTDKGSAENSARPMQVRRGETVQVAIIGNDFSLSYAGVATEAGRAGDPIRVRFPTSGKLLVAKVSGPGKVTIED